MSRRKHIIFILATTEPQKLPATILSRVLRFDFKLVGLDKLVSHVKNVFSKSGIKAEEQAVISIAKAGNGSVRDTLSIADMCASFANNDIKYTDVLEVLGTSDQEVLSDLASCVLSGDIGNFIRKFNSEVKSGKNILNLLEDLTKEFRDLLVIKAGGKTKELVDLPMEIQEKLERLGQNYELTRINEALSAFSGIEADLKYSSNPQLLIEVTAMKFLKREENKSIGESAKNFVKEVKISSTQSTDVNSHKVWGQVLTELHRQNVVLHSACADICDVQIVQNNFIISSESEMIVQIMKKSENYADLVACFKKLGYNYNIEIVKKQTEKKIDKTKLLSEKLGISVQIKNKKD